METVSKPLKNCSEVNYLNGNLYCASMYAMPNGAYNYTCNGCFVDNSWLVCGNCISGKGFVSSSIHLSACTSFNNVNGLTCTNSEEAKRVKTIFVPTHHPTLPLGVVRTVAKESSKSILFLGSIIFLLVILSVTIYGFVMLKKKNNVSLL